jgi:hypothetical protein
MMKLKTNYIKGPKKITKKKWGLNLNKKQMKKWIILDWRVILKRKLKFKR